MDTGASASVVGKRLARKLGIWKRAKKVKVRQGDGRYLGGNFVVNTTFKVMDSSLVLGKFGMDAEVLIMEEEPLEDGEILLIIDASERYSRYAQYFSAEQAARLPEDRSWDHQIPLQDSNAKIPTGAIYKTTWEEDEALRKYLQEKDRKSVV